MGKVNRFYDGCLIRFHAGFVFHKEFLAKKGDVAEVIKVMMDENPDYKIGFTLKLWIELKDGRRVVFREDSDAARSFIAQLEVLPPTEMSKVLFAND